jgi:hypothetical protein
MLKNTLFIFSLAAVMLFANGYAGQGEKKAETNKEEPALLAVCPGGKCSILPPDTTPRTPQEQESYYLQNGVRHS